MDVEAQFQNLLSSELESFRSKLTAVFATVVRHGAAADVSFPARDVAQGRIFEADLATRRPVCQGGVFEVDLGTCMSAGSEDMAQFPSSWSQGSAWDTAQQQHADIAHAAPKLGGGGSTASLRSNGTVDLDAIPEDKDVAKWTRHEHQMSIMDKVGSHMSYESYDQGGNRSHASYDDQVSLDDMATRRTCSDRLSGANMMPVRLLALKPEWEPDDAQTKHIIESAKPEASAEVTCSAWGQQLRVSHLLGLEEDRVLANMRHNLWDQSQHGSVGSGGAGHSTVLQSLFRMDHQLGVTSEDMEDDARRFRCPFPLNPHSTGRLIWDIMGLLLVLYDIVMIPIVQMVLQHESSSVQVMYVIVNTFWTVDIILSFTTATWQNSELTTSLAEIARLYAKSWLLVDLSMVLPEWICLVLDSSKGGFVLLKVLKSFRIIRLLRLVKMESILQKLLRRVNSENMVYAVHLLQLVFLFLILVHFTACSWYFLGQTTGNGWFEERVAAASKDVRGGYLLAVHWSIAQFHGSMDVVPGNDQERLFAVGVLVLGMITMAVFVSSLTNIIFQMKQANIKKNDQHSRLCSYFTRHAVSMQLMLSVKAHLQLQTDVSTVCQDDQELLQALPDQLARSLLFEVRTASCGGHWLFAWMVNMHGTAFRDICYSAFTCGPAIKGHPVFECTTACAQMYFVESGMLRYIPITDKSYIRQGTRRASMGPDSRFARRLGRTKCGTELTIGCWCCEPALWVAAWQTRGELVTEENSILLCLEGANLALVVSKYPSLNLDVVVYARFVLRKIKESKTPHTLDLWRLTD